jgi:hypothetical protein
MKQNTGPIAIGIALVVIVGLFVVLWRIFLPPTPDYSTPTKIPSQVQKNREMIERFKAGDRTRPTNPSFGR